jgi:hypothetical protein
MQITGWLFIAVGAGILVQVLAIPLVPEAMTLSLIDRHLGIIGCWVLIGLGVIIKWIGRDDR